MQLAPRSGRCMSGVKAQTCRHVSPTSQYGKNTASVTCGAVLTNYQHNEEGRKALPLSWQQTAPGAHTSACLPPSKSRNMQESIWARLSCRTAVTGSPREWQMNDCVWFMSYKGRNHVDRESQSDRVIGGTAGKKICPAFLRFRLISSCTWAICLDRDTIYLL